MAIIFSSQANVTGGNNILGDVISNAIGVPGFPQGGGRKSGITSDIEAVRDKMNNIVEKLMGKSEEFDRNYVEKGRENIIEGHRIEGGKASPLEKAKIRQVYSQTPNFSVIIRKRAFSSLSHLYDATLMDEAEKWLMRATKRLIERKCGIMAEYERLAKVERMMHVGASTGSIISAIFTSAAEEQLGKEKFSAMREMQKIIEARQPPNVTTYFTDPDEPEIPELGHGHGAFEITTISDLNTELDLDGNGSCSFTIEDPYRILFINEEDIEVSIKETAESLNTRPIKEAELNRVLNDAQVADESLTQSRSGRGVSEITFSISMNGSSGVTAILDALGMELTSFNLDDIPEGHTLNSHEKMLFGLIMNGLKAYDQMVRLNLMRGQNISTQNDKADYVRKRMRLFYLGKSVLQPMDTINVYIDSGTRRSGEGEDVTESGNIFSLDGAIKTASSVLSRYRENGTLDQGPDEQLLLQEYKRAGGKDTGLSFDDFKKVRTMQLSTECGTHVFGGIIRSVTDRFDASTGKYILSVNADSNMEWLKLSRYNAQPSLDQTQGLVYDPFTPFKFKIDPATGLPIGKPELLDENSRILEGTTVGSLRCRKTFFDTGPNRGNDVKSIEDLKVDVQRLGGRLHQMFHHAPGLKYRWKEGIMTSIYDMSTVDPLSGSKIDHKQLVRDVGLFTANTAFDNMDAANVICTMVTGKPYNASTFIQSAMNSGTFIVDTSLNGKRSYFSSMLDVQNSFIRTHGGFEPYKKISIDPSDLARAVLLQQQLTGKSSKISQLRTEYAKLADKIANFKGSKDKTLKDLFNKLKSKRLEVRTELSNATTEFSELTKTGANLEDNIIQIAGDDISFDLAGDISDPTKARDFGDRLFHVTLRRREDVIYNKDKNLLIVSDEYDKDYDIQAFVLQLRGQVADMWKSTWQSVYQLCQTVAETLNFEFFCMGKDTRILVKNKQNKIFSKSIEKFEFGDSVLSVDEVGNIEWKEATLLKRKLNVDEYMVKIRTGGGYELLLSNKHKLLNKELKEVVVDSINEGSILGTTKSLPNEEMEVIIDLEKLFCKHEWYKSSEKFFKIGGQGSRCKYIPKKIKLNKDIAWMLGMFIAGGSISDPTNRKNRRGYHTIFSLSFSEIEAAKRLVKIVKKYFNIDGNIYRYKKYTRCTVDFGSQVLTKFMRYIFNGSHAKNKFIPDIIWRGFRENKIAFLAGLCEGDAAYNRRISLSSKSNILLHDVFQLLLMLGVQGRIDKYNKIHIYGKENIKIFLPYMKSWKHYISALRYCNSKTSFENRKEIDVCKVKSISVQEYNDYVYDLTVEDNHTFILFGTLSHNCNTQGHLEFRPPQYNRTPASVLAAMLSVNHQSGIKVFPDFLLKLFQTREESIVNDIAALEWEIRMNAALLGKTKVTDVQKFVSSHSGSTVTFITNEDEELGLDEVISGNKVIAREERQKLRNIVRTANADIQAENSGLFTSKSQVNIYKELVGETGEINISQDSKSRETAYKNAVRELAKLTGRPAKNFEEYDKIKVGAKRNGQSTPSTDVSNIISKISGLVSRRSKLLRTLERLIEQNLEFAEINDAAETKLKSKTAFNVVDLFKKKNSSDKDEVSGVYRKLIEDDTRDVLGHLSGDRFVIRDEHIIDASFTEQPPQMTVAAVSGTEPIVGEGSGNIVGMPLYLAYGVDFDMWRQYGWRGEKPFEKPFFWSADKQCAPYAVMLLSRQRKNIVTGTVTVFGNEYYQLGDVVYVADRHLLYYVHKISHKVSYNGEFKTILHLKYGHPVGEYIPTPLDVIGKLSTAGAKSQNAFRVRREKSRSNVLLGVIRFPNTNADTSDNAKTSMFSGQYGLSNFKKLVNASIASQRELDETDTQNSSKIFVMTYSGDETLQEERRDAVVEWFQDPTKPSEPRGGIGMNGLDGVSDLTSSSIGGKEFDVKRYKVSKKLVESNHIRQCLPTGEKFTTTENELISRYNMVASQEALTIDGTLENVVEIRLRRAPPGGWTKGNS